MKRTYTTEQIVSKQRLQALRDAVAEPVRAFRRECADAENILSRGRAAFHFKNPQPPDFYRTCEGTWGYWDLHFVSNALATLCCLRAADFRLAPGCIGVIQPGGGPAEDLIGLLEYLRMQNRSPTFLHYLSIDEGNWGRHLDAVNTAIIPMLFPDFAVDARMRQVAFGEWHEDDDASWFEHVDFVLVIVANTLVTCKKQGRIAELRNMLTRLAGRLSSKAVHWLLIEPSSCKQDFSSIVNDLFGSHVHLEEISCRHSPQGNRAKPVLIDRVFLGPQVLSVSTPPS